ncbi:hypothetical protein IV500_04250 [Paeniglutamicibacter antarcticus]|uniref:Uncharacterized protein n=1 Tax=Arthrobacter terrae TaxID=2935737 RepID=A0A931CKG5_9MICC|nr:hypothetical protein [Arthrobacter terrae]MBG0738632.1 hypothetical protein [Arthrobacter terrae]
MNAFDESKHPRSRGKFAAVSHREPAVTLSEKGFDARYWGLPALRPGSWVFGNKSCAEILAGSVVDGPLSRGSVQQENLDAFARWESAALNHGTAEGKEFAAGLEDGIRTLHGTGAGDSAAGLLGTAPLAPTTHPSRVNWQLRLRSASSEARYRGQLAAGVILSGAEKWWGISDDLDLAILGSAESTPRPAGAWSSLSSR